MTESTKITTNNLKTEIQKKEPSKAGTFQQLLKSMEGEIKKALPKHITPERMMRVALSAFSRNEKLQKCDPMSIISGIITSSQLGLEIDTPLGQAYLVPYGQQAQFIIGYKGLIDLAYRTGQYKMIGGYVVYENDEFEYELGLNQKLFHKPARSPQGDPIFYYAVYKTISGGEGFVVMSREQIQAHSKKYSAAVQKGWKSPWDTDFDSMALKTVLKQLLKYAPKSSEFLSQDETVKNEISDDMSLTPNIIDISNGEKNG